MPKLGPGGVIDLGALRDQKKSAEISDRPGIQTYALAGCGASLKFAILPDLKQDGVFFVGLIADGKVIPLCFASDHDSAVEALGAITMGFLALGYQAGQITIRPGVEDAT